MKKLNKELEILNHINNSIYKTLDGLDEGFLIISGGHSILSLRKSTDRHEVIETVIDLVRGGDLIQTTKSEDVFNNSKIIAMRYYTISKQGKLRLKPFYIRIPIRFWQILKSDGYVFLSIISTVLSITSIILALSAKFQSQPTL